MQAEEPCALSKQEASAIDPAVQPMQGCSLLDGANDFTRAGSGANFSHSVLFPPQQRLLCLLSSFCNPQPLHPAHLHMQHTPFKSRQVSRAHPTSASEIGFLFSHYANPFSKLFFVLHPVYGSRLAFQVLFTFTFSVLRFWPLACSPDVLQIAGTHVPIQNLKISNKKHEEQWLSSRKVSPAVSRHLSGTQWAFSTRDIQGLLAVAYAKVLA